MSRTTSCQFNMQIRARLITGAVWNEEERVEQMFPPSEEVTPGLLCQHKHRDTRGITKLNKSQKPRTDRNKSGRNFWKYDKLILKTDIKPRTWRRA
ncbi:uncharacterized [Tachysurus ichikawai]